jgi:hypothetical protein
MSARPGPPPLVLLDSGALRRQQLIGGLENMLRSIPESPESFLTLQLTIDAAGVDRDAEALRHSLGKLRSRNVRLGRPELQHKLHEFSCELVPGSGPSFLRQQARETSLLKGGLRLIERWPRETECPGCLADRLLVDIHLPQHLVLDLEQILRIEKFVLAKGLVPDLLRARIQHSLLAEQGSFGLPRICHPGM